MQAWWTWIVAALAPLSVGGGVTAAAPAVRTSVPPPVTTVAPEWARCGQWWQLALDVGWTPDQLPTLDRVMWCESHCEPHAWNRSGASGLLQVMPMWHRGRDPFEPATNLTIGLEVLAQQGWRAWSCY